MTSSGSFRGVGNFENGRIDGVMSFPGGIYENLDINGVATAEGPLEALSLDISGVFDGRSDVTTNTLKTTGVVTINNNLRVTSANIDGVVTVHGPAVEAERIICDGILTASGRVSAKEIDAQGYINAREIVGESISIQSHTRSFFYKIWTNLKEAVGSQDYSKVDLIDANTVTLRGVHAGTVRGRVVSIGPGCRVDRVSALESLHIDPDAVVTEVSPYEEQTDCE